MKRAFLWGLAWSLMVVGAASLIGISYPDPRWESITEGLVFVVLGALAVQVARRAAPGKSYLVAVAGWLLGFCAISVVASAVLLVLTGRPF